MSGRELLSETFGAGMAAGVYYWAVCDPTQVCNAGEARIALDAVRLREGSVLWPRFPVRWECAGDNECGCGRSGCLINVAGGGAPAAALGLCHKHDEGDAYRDPGGKLETFLLADWDWGWVWGAADRGWDRPRCISWTQEIIRSSSGTGVSWMRT